MHFFSLTNSRLFRFYCFVQRIIIHYCYHKFLRLFFDRPILSVSQFFLCKNPRILGRRFFNFGNLPNPQFIKRLLGCFVQSKLFPMSLKEPINDQEILDNSGKVSTEIAKAFTESIFEKNRITQDRLYRGDFDRPIEDIGKT